MDVIGSIQKIRVISKLNLRILRITYTSLHTKYTYPQFGRLCIREAQDFEELSESGDRQRMYVRTP